MPTYEYRCEACGHELELFQGITEAPKRKCPACKKSKLRRKIGGGAGFLFKGSGFYLTDYRSDSYKKGADADAKPPSDAPKADAAKSETSKPEPKKSATPAAPLPPKGEKKPDKRK
jgi:putative FmdB family regulatory protein